MSDTTLSKELLVAHKTFRLTLDDLEKLTINAMKSAFLPYNRRIEVIYNVIKPGFVKARQRAKRKGRQREA
jgi:adenosine deaminase